MADLLFCNIMGAVSDLMNHQAAILLLLETKTHNWTVNPLYQIYFFFSSLL